MELNRCLPDLLGAVTFGMAKEMGERVTLDHTVIVTYASDGLKCPLARLSERERSVLLNPPKNPR